MQIGSSELNRLAFAFVNACFARSRVAGLLPRIPGRYLLPGREYFYQDIYQLGEYEALIDALAGDERVKAIYGADQANIYSDVGKYVTGLFQRILRETDGDFSPASFDHWFGEFQRELFQPEVTRRTIWFLGKLKYKDCPLKIDDETEMRYFDYGEVEHLLEKEIEPWDYWNLHALRGYALVLTRNVNKNWAREFEEGKPKINDKLLGVLTALKLFKPGHLYLQYAINFEVSRFPMESPLIVGYRRMFTETSHEYIFQAHDLVAFVSLWKLIYSYLYSDKNGREIENKTKNRLREAIAIFDLSYEERWQDMLVDLMTALEALLLEGEGGKSKKLQRRISALIGKDIIASRQIRRDIKKIYDLRSSVVHGEFMSREEFQAELRRIAGISTGELTYEEELLTIEKCKDYVRQVIRAILNLAANHGIELGKDFFGQLDASEREPPARAELQRRAGIV